GRPPCRERTPGDEGRPDDRGEERGNHERAPGVEMVDAAASTLCAESASTMMPASEPGAKPRKDREPPVPPVCQVRFGVRFFVVIQAQPMRSPSSKSARGSAAPAPGALPSRTARSQMDMSCVVERIAPAGADPPRVHGADGRPEAVYP